MSRFFLMIRQQLRSTLFPYTRLFRPYLTAGPRIFQGSSSMLAGSVIGVPGPVATTRPPWTWRLSTAVGGRYRPTLVRSSPSSGAMSTRSPTTIRRLGDSSGMGSSIHPRAPAGLAHGGNGDVDHVPRLTGPGAALLMRPCRSGSRGPHSSPFGRDNRHAKPDGSDGTMELDPPDRVGLDLGRPLLDRRLAGLRVPPGAQREFLLGGGGESAAAPLPHVRAGRRCVGHGGLPLHDPVPPRAQRPSADGPVDVVVGCRSDVLVLLGGHGALPPSARGLDLGIAQARRGAHLGNLEKRGHVAVYSARFDVAPAGRAVDRLHAAHFLVDDRGHDLHVHAASDDERAALGLDGLPGEPTGPRRAPVVDRKSVV